jgi:hypothetical protein
MDHPVALHRTCINDLKATGDPLDYLFQKLIFETSLFSLASPAYGSTSAPSRAAGSGTTARGFFATKLCTIL